MLRIVTVFVLMSEFRGWPCEEEAVGSQNCAARQDSHVAVPLPVAASRGSEHSVLGQTQSSPDTAHVRSVQTNDVFARSDILTAHPKRLKNFGM